MPTITRNTANIIAAVLALALVGGMVIRTSTAVFTAQTDNDGNSLAAGTIVLTDNDGGSAALTMGNIAPGEFSESCLTVTYSGTLDPEAVKVFSTSAFATTPAATGPGTAAVDMHEWVRISILEGDGTDTGAFGSCAGFDDTSATTLVDRVFLDVWDGTDVDYTSGEGTWNPTDATDLSRMYKIILELDLTTDNDFQDARLDGINVSWATRSTATPGLVP